MINKQTADLVAAEITRTGQTISGVARMTGIPRTTLDRKLRGHSDFGVTEIVQIAKALGISPADLLPDVFGKAVAA